MARIQSLLFFTGGVLVPRLAFLAQQALLPPDAPVKPCLALSLRNLEKQLCSGRLGPQEFCRMAIKAAGAGFSPGELAGKMQQGIALAPGMLSLIEELSETCTLQALCDYPREWFLPALPRLGLPAHLPAGAIFFSARYEAASVSLGLISALVREGVILPGKTLLVDGCPERARQAIRAGVDVALFVDVPRLRRDLALWKLLPHPQLNPPDASSASSNAPTSA